MVKLRGGKIASQNFGLFNLSLPVMISIVFSGLGREVSFQPLLEIAGFETGNFYMKGM